MTADRTVARPYATQPSGPRVDFTASLLPFAGPHRVAYCTAADLPAFARTLWDGTLPTPAYVSIPDGKMITPSSEQPGLTRWQLFHGDTSVAPIGVMARQAP
ncbi:hypothetical protein AB0K16_28045 [Nonomuraea jabiensis]|uniref:hypothetical protein n=1 Tax=Nonomuraea jabiensis TaxID=882448 RepID=UPI003431C298